MGALTAATWLPWLVVGLPAGAWVDQLPLRWVMIAADLLAAAALVSVPIALVAGVLTLPHLLVTALLTGTATVFFRTAYAGLLPSIVADEHLEPANARMFGTESAAQVAGPGLAGMVAQWLSAAIGVLLDAVSFLVSAVCLWRMSPTARGTRNTSSASLRSRIADGVRWLRRDRYLRWLVVLGGFSNFGLTGLNTLMVLFLVDDLGLAASGVGAVLAAGSIGGLIGAVAAPGSRRGGAPAGRRPCCCCSPGRRHSLLPWAAPAGALCGSWRDWPHWVSAWWPATWCAAPGGNAMSRWTCSAGSPRPANW